MNNIFFCLIVMTTMLNTFCLSLSFSHINRSFMMISYSVIENSVVMVSDSEDYQPYYNEEYLEENVHAYLREEIGKDLTNATLKIYYFYPETGELCIDHCCRGVSITLKGKINGFINYRKALDFTIEENPNL